MKLRTCSECGRRRECVECAPERSVDARSEYAGSVAPSVERAETAWLCAACAVEAGVPREVVARALGGAA